LSELGLAQRDARFREALFTEVINTYLAGDTTVGKAVLRDLVNATIGFEGLAAAQTELKQVVAFVDVLGSYPVAV